MPTPLGDGVQRNEQNSGPPAKPLCSVNKTAHSPACRRLARHCGKHTIHPLDSSSPHVETGAIITLGREACDHSHQLHLPLCTSFQTQLSVLLLSFPRAHGTCGLGGAGEALLRISGWVLVLCLQHLTRCLAPINTQ